MDSNYPIALQEALQRGVLIRLPLTFLPFVNQQLRQWDHLFQNERRSVEQLLLFVSQMSDAESVRLFQDVVQLEEKMGVRHWRFSTTEQTIENSSQLAKSPYFQQWRTAVQAVFDASEQQDRNAKAENARRRLIIISIPAILPVKESRVWQRWRGAGRAISVRRNPAQNSKAMIEQVIAGMKGVKNEDANGPVDTDHRSSSDMWIVDAGDALVGSVLNSHQQPVALSYTRLDLYRQKFSNEMNTMRKDLVDADAVYDRLRKVDVRPWCPSEVADEPAVREFIRALYLSGNGAVIFGNSFVEWAASEALRRARPSFLAAQFGLRAKPKPFTGVAVFENPEKVNPLPSVDDPNGSALDAEILAAYIWLAAARFEEYQRSTVCICVAESMNQCYLIAPADFSLHVENNSVDEDKLTDALYQWMDWGLA